MEYIILFAAIIFFHARFERSSRRLEQTREELKHLQDAFKAIILSGPPQTRTGTSPAEFPANQLPAQAPTSSTSYAVHFVGPTLAPPAVRTSEQPTPSPTENTATPTPVPFETPLEIPEPSSSTDSAAGPTVAPSAPNPPPRRPTRDKTTPEWLGTVARWLFSGNLVAKFGLLIMFIGVGFLLKYAAENYYVPIELRLAAVVVGDIGLLTWGWRIRNKRRDISLPTQGGAIAILMLVVFGAFQRYGLLPVGISFGLLVVLTAFTCVLALLQEAVWLAAFGIVGGFAGPLILEASHANHTVLFSYYALLNAGIFVLAIQRAWRILNLLGFVFTFVIGTGWGLLRYQPDHYISAQAFLVLFFLFYVAIGIAFSTKQGVKSHRYVDVTLVLGTPLLAFGLQYGLVKETRFGVAFSALGLGGFYVLVAQFLWRRWRDKSRELVAAFLALGVVFATLTIPLALDNRWTSGAWALEGCGFVWFGLRQRQTRVWVFGLILQAGAWLYFIRAVGGLDHAAAVNSNLWLGFLLLAGSAFGIASNFRRNAENAPSNLFGQAANAFLAIAGCWLLGGLWTETILRFDGAKLADLLVVGAIGTAFLLNVLGSRLQWNQARHFALAAQFVGAVALVIVAVRNWMQIGPTPSDQPLIGCLLIAGSAFISSWYMHRKLPDEKDNWMSTGVLLWAGLWWFGPVLGSMASHLVGWLPESIGASETVWVAISESLIAASAIICVLLARRLPWDPLKWFGITCWIVLTRRMISVLYELYSNDSIPAAVEWVSLVLLWCGSELLLYLWRKFQWKMNGHAVQLIHLVRTAGPWLAIAPAGEILVDRWLYGTAAQQELLATAGLAISGSWSRYLPTWVMMLGVVWVATRSRADRWPVTPVGSWYRRWLVPCASAWALLHVGVWNLLQNGEMAPLPYLPLLNPLDLTTGFAVALVVSSYRVLAVEAAANPGLQSLMKNFGKTWAPVAYFWFNLVLLRSAAHYLGIAYRADELMNSLFVQSMLSLVWSATALLLMRRAARHLQRASWLTGALLLGVVVGKLFLIDLSSSGSIERIVSFVGVGLLMLAIGYLAPFPKLSGGIGGAAVSAD